MATFIVVYRRTWPLFIELDAGLLSWIRRLPYLAILGEHHNDVAGYSLFTIAQYKTMVNGGDAGPGLAWCY